MSEHEGPREVSQSRLGPNRHHSPITPRVLQDSLPKKAVVLAAGKGKRLRPFTDHTPKPLLQHQGQAILDYVLASLVQAGVQHVCLVTHHLGGQIEAHVADGEKWGLRVTYRDQAAPLGSGHALMSAEDFLTEPSFVLASDYLLPDCFLADLKEAYLQQKASIAVSLKDLPADELRSRSSVRFDESGRIVEIVEKPAPGTAPSQIGASLIFIVPPEIRRYLGRIEISARGEYELQRAINLMLEDGYSIAGLKQNSPAEWEMPSIS